MGPLKDALQLFGVPNFNKPWFYHGFVTFVIIFPYANMA